MHNQVNYLESMYIQYVYIKQPQKCDDNAYSEKPQENIRLC